MKKYIKAFRELGRMDIMVVKLTRSEDAVKVAYRIFQSRGDNVCLLSPACASFDLFEDYEDRGRTI